METDFYDIGSDALGIKDLDGNLPAIVMDVVTRSAGKTTSTFKYILEKYQNEGRKFCYIFRTQFEMMDSSSMFFDYLLNNPEHGDSVEDKPIGGGIIREYVFKKGDEKTVKGYCVPLRQADNVKKYSQVFSDVDTIIFEEFQKEDGKYLQNEITKLQSLFYTIARGWGHAIRKDVRMIMLSNDVTIMNPYFIYFGVHKRIKADTKTLRGNGWILRYLVHESTVKDLEENLFTKAFEGTDYADFVTGHRQLYSCENFIENKISGNSHYLFTICYGKKYYGVREFMKDGIIYVSHNYEKNYPTILAFRESDFSVNSSILRRYSMIWKNIRDAYNMALLRFDNVETKNVMFDILGIDFMR